MAVLFALALLLAACGDDGGEVSTEGGDAPDPVEFADLVGTTFTTDVVTGHELVAGTEITLTFIDGRISAMAGCNTQNGGAAVEGGKLVVDRLASTMMGCEIPLMDQDRWLGGFLEGSPDIALADGILTLTAGDEVMELIEQTS
jgi:heat shock protein HslJ